MGPNPVKLYVGRCGRRKRSQGVLVGQVGAAAANDGGSFGQLSLAGNIGLGGKVVDVKLSLVTQRSPAHLFGRGSVGRLDCLPLADQLFNEPVKLIATTLASNAKVKQLAIGESLSLGL